MSTIKAEKYDEYDLELIDSDLSSWEAGDRLVIASTDYDYEQAEEVTVQSVNGNKVKVKGNQNSLPPPTLARNMFELQQDLKV